MSYAPTPGTVPARAIAHLRSLGSGAEIATAVLAEAVGHPSASLIPCLEIPRKHGALVSRKVEGKGPRGLLLWRLGTDAEIELAQQRIAEQRQAEQEAKAQERREDAEAKGAAPRSAPGPASLGWKPAKPLYAPPPDEPEVPAVKQDLTTEPGAAAIQPGLNTGQREQHLVQRAWFSSDGQLMVEAGEHEFVFDRLEARQFVRTVRELGEAWA